METTSLLLEIQALKDRINELERSASSTALLCSQADAVAHHTLAVANGPSCLDNFHKFDLDSIVTELQSLAPDLYKLYMTIGDVKRNAKDEEVTTEEIKAVTSLCSLLNARSARTKGLQLLISMMLVARATSRQV